MASFGGGSSEASSLQETKALAAGVNGGVKLFGAEAGVNSSSTQTWGTTNTTTLSTNYSRGMNSKKAWKEKYLR